MMTKSSKHRKFMEIHSPWSEPQCPETSCERCLVLVQPHGERFMLATLPNLEIFFQGLDDVFRIMFWSTHLTTGHQEDPLGNLGLRNSFLNWDGGDGKRDECEWYFKVRMERILTRFVDLISLQP